MRVLVLVIVSFDKPVYYDMLRVWKERILNNDFCDRCDVWFIQCKSDAEWIGDIVNDIGEPLRSSPMTPPLYEKSKQTQSEADPSEADPSEADPSEADPSEADPSEADPSEADPSEADPKLFTLGSASLKDRFELDIANKTLFIRGDECLIPGILHKTVEALSFFLHHSALLEPSFNSMGLKGNDEFPLFVWRTNLSSVLDFEGLQRYLGTINLSGVYGGYIGLGSLNNGSSTFFASGAGFLMSRDVAEYLVKNKQFLRWDLIDDVAIGALLEPKFGIVPIDRCWVQTGSEDISALIANGIFHFRCESYQHLRTVEFMQYVKRIIEVNGSQCSMDFVDGLC